MGFNWAFKGLRQTFKIIFHIFIFYKRTYIFSPLLVQKFFHILYDKQLDHAKQNDMSPDTYCLF